MTTKYVQDTIERIEAAYEIVDGKLIDSVWLLSEANAVCNALKDALGVIGMLQRDTPQMLTLTEEEKRTVEEMTTWVKITDRSYSHHIEISRLLVIVSRLAALEAENVKLYVALADLADNITATDPIDEELADALLTIINAAPEPSDEVKRKMYGDQ